MTGALWLIGSDLPRVLPLSLLSLVLVLRDEIFSPMTLAALEDTFASVSVCGGDIMAAS